MSLTQAVKLWDKVAPAWPLWCRSLKEHALSPGWSPPELQAGNLLWHSPPLWTAGKHLLQHGLSHSFQGASAPTCSPPSTPVPLALELFLTASHRVLLTLTCGVLLFSRAVFPSYLSWAQGSPGLSTQRLPGSPETLWPLLRVTTGLSVKNTGLTGKNLK